MDSSAFQAEFQRRASEVEDALKAAFHAWDDERDPATSRLVESMAYSALGPGKRFRPVLALWAAEAAGGPAKRAIPWALAVEMVHAYSLIHDDLPCMDDDVERRGRPTNHVRYDESTALLAGDALLTEAFGLVAQAYADRPEVAVKLVALLSRAGGVRGMVGGQAIDLASEGKKISADDLRKLHARKTGALIAASVEGAAIAAEGPAPAILAAGRYGATLGLAFQIADDLLDATGDEDAAGKKLRKDGTRGKETFLTLLGVDRARAQAALLVDQAIAHLRGHGAEADILRGIARYVLARDR